MAAGSSFSPSHTRIEVKSLYLEGGARCLKLENSPKTPLVSVITVVYNGVEHLAKTVESVLKLKTGAVEYIVIDGGSSDGTVDLLRQYEDRIDFWVSEKDNGIYDAMNKGIRLARGDFILHLNIGDVLLCIPPALGGDLPPNTAAFAGCVQIGKHNLHKPSIGPFLRLNNTIHHQGCFYRRTHKLHYDTAYRVFADFDLNQRIFKSGGVIVLSDDIVASHDQGGISHNANHFYEVFKIVKSNQGLFWLVASFLYFKLCGVFRRINF